MEQLIERIVASTGLSADGARKATGILLGYFEKNSTHPAMHTIIDALPGSRQAITDAEQGAGSGGMLGKLGGMVGSFGGGSGANLMAMAGKLTQAGLNMDQMKILGKTLYQFAQEQLGPDKAREIFKSVPGVGQMFP